MADLNNFAFTGRLSKDAETKNINGKTLVEMDVANNTGYGDYKKTTWLKVKWWGDRAANAAPIFTKGALVTGAGQMTTDTYTGRDNKEHTNIVVTVMGLDVLSKPKGNDSQGAEPETSEEPVF